jgi:hypothetical protein
LPLKNNNLQKKAKDLKNQFQSDLLSFVNEKNQKTRASIMITENKIIDIDSQLNQFLSQKDAQNERICIFDCNLFETKLNVPSSDKILKIAFRFNEDCSVSKNNLQFGFKALSDDFLITEMPLIYIFERILLKVISDFKPSLFICLNNSEFTRNKIDDSFILNGDCKNIYFFNILVFSFMLERIQKNVIPNIILIHQHNKILQTQHYLPGIVRTLQDEGYPNFSTSIKIIYWKLIKNILILEPKVVDLIEKFKTEINSIQTNLETEDLIDYENKIIKSKTRIPGVIGGHHQKLKIFKKFFLKKMGGNHALNEIYNYYLLQKFYPKISPFLTKCYGVIFVSKEFDFDEELFTEIIKSGKTNSKEALFYPMERYFFQILLN